MSDSFDNTEIRYTYRCELVERLRASGSMQIGRLRLQLPGKFGFCWGVDRALAMVQAARNENPGRRMWLLNSIIHNPRVNADMREMGIGFLKGPHAEEQALAALGPEDVVIIPAFSAEVEEMEQLQRAQVQVVDTTCPWVIKPHKRSLRYLDEGFTTLIHGTVGHDETRATCSLVRHHGGQYLVVHHMAEAEILAGFLEGRILAQDLKSGLHPEAFLPEFDPDRHLDRIGLINQTTMLASESRAIGERIKQALIRTRGETALTDCFRDFDTICRATQENQDAATMVAATRPDLFLVVGGYDSSNTRNLARIGDDQDVPAFHVEGPDSIQPDRLQHLDRHAGVVREESDWLPAEGPVSVAFSAGASTPDSILGEVICRVIAAAGESLPAEAMAAG